MKTSMSFLLFLLLPILYLRAQEPAAAYPKAMQSALAQMQQAKSPEERTAVVNTISRISEAMPNEWLPGYYKNLARLNWAGNMANSKEKDQLLEEVLADLEKQLKTQTQNSELLSLKGYHHLLYVAADPVSRGAQYSGVTIQVLQQAIAANPQNPRPYLLLGQMQLGMAQFMKSSTEEACKLISKANELYKAAGKSASLEPAWGAETAKRFMEYCLPKE